MAPSYLALQMAAAEKRADCARDAGDSAKLQNELAEMTRLSRAYYGRPQPCPGARNLARR
jgi:hypothetical protein